MSFVSFAKRWFGAKTLALQTGSSKPNPDTDLYDRTEILLEDLNDFQENIAFSLDSISNSFLSISGSRTNNNISILTSGIGSNADLLHSHSGTSVSLSNNIPQAISGSSSPGTSNQASRSDHTHQGLSGGSVISFGNNSLGSGITTKYVDPWWNGTSAAGTNPLQIKISRSGTLRNFMYLARLSGIGSFIATVRINNIASLLNISILPNEINKENTTTSISVNRGDVMDIEITRTIAGTPTDIIFTLELL